MPVIETKRPVALLDVDHTLLFHSPDLNKNLVNALKNQGIKDIYLFTDMTFQTSSVEDRRDLIKRLEGSGFTVHGSITPSDVYWSALNDNAQETEALSNDINKGEVKKVFGEDFTNFLRDNHQTLHQILSNYSPSTEKPGQAFAEVNKQLSNENAQKYLSMSQVAKAFADIKAQEKGYPHTKGLLLDLFLKNKPEWVNSVVIADDNEKVIASTSNFKPTEEQGSVEPGDTDITVIHVTDQKMSEQEFVRQLRGNQKDIKSTQFKSQLRKIQGVAFEVSQPPAESIDKEKPRSLEKYFGDTPVYLNGRMINGTSLDSKYLDLGLRGLIASELGLEDNETNKQRIDEVYGLLTPENLSLGKNAFNTQLNIISKGAHLPEDGIKSRVHLILNKEEQTLKIIETTQVNGIVGINQKWADNFAFDSEIKTKIDINGDKSQRKPTSVEAAIQRNPLADFLDDVKNLFDSVKEYLTEKYDATVKFVSENLYTAEQDKNPSATDESEKRFSL